MEPLFHKAGGGTIMRLEESGDINDLLKIFERVAEEEGWQPGSQLRAYPDTARYLAVLVGSDLAGGLQVVLPDAGGLLPYRAVWPEAQVCARGLVAEVTVLAIRRECRGRSGFFWPLCAELWRLCACEGVGTIVLEATPRMLERYRRVGWPLEVAGDLRLHWGEECYLCKMDVRTVAGSLLQLALRSSSYRALIVQAVRPLGDARCAGDAALP